jgi:ATP-binding cassette subfamily B protein
MIGWLQGGFEKRSSHLGGMNGGTKSGFKALVSGGSYLFAALLAHGGAFSIGAVFLLAATLFQFSEAFLRCVQGFMELNIASKRLESTLEYVNLPNVLYRGTIPVEKRRDYEYELEFHDVSFKYPGSEEYALKRLNLKLCIGQRLAVVGMNGSGKTTMIKLLCRLYDPTEGKITLNGIDIRKYDYDEYMSLFGVVFQDFRLFSFQLGQNVAASVGVDAERAELCLEKAGLGDRLRELHSGLETCLYKDYAEDGVEISGGEAQKIALARALYKDAPFVILDEPTAALDPIAEFEVYSRMNEIVGDKTAVFISHRLSSCRFCHDIAVFHEGELVQRGSHEALLADAHGKYRELWEAQAQYYMPGSSGDWKTA